MEFRDAIHDLKRSRAWILWGTLAVVAVAVIVSALQPVTHTTSLSFSVNRIAAAESEYYEYDGYYAIQAADLFSQTVVSWFMTPSVLLEVYERAGIDPAIGSLDQFTSRFKTRKYSAQNIVVKYTERDPATAQALADAIVSIVETKAGELNKNETREALFEVRGSAPVTVEDHVNWTLTILIGLVVGFIASTAVTTSVRYLRG